MIKYLLAVVILVAPNIAIAQDLTDATVISNNDGDTMTAKIGNVRKRVRLACIDAPEKAQTGGLQQLLPANSQVKLRIVEVDSYGRSAAEIFNNGQLVNLQMVREGQAVVYRQHLNQSCPETKQQYLNAEKLAKSQRLGFWSRSPVCLPSNFRQKKCS
jgi:micrococcal nuclease